MRAIHEAAVTADGERDRRRWRLLHRAVRLDAATGLRLAELRALKWGHIDESARRIDVVGKGNKYRSVPLFEDGAGVLRELRDAHEEAFGLPPGRGAPVLPGLPYDGTSKDITYFLEKAGLKEKVGRKAAHVLRSTFASWAVEAGVPIYAVCEGLGHSSVTTTEKSYAHLAPDYVPEAATEAFGGRNPEICRSVVERPPEAVSRKTSFAW